MKRTRRITSIPYNNYTAREIERMYIDSLEMLQKARRIRRRNRQMIKARRREEIIVTLLNIILFTMSMYMFLVLVIGIFG